MLVSFGEKRCRKNLPLAAASLLMFASRKHAEQLLRYFTRMADEHDYAESHDGVFCATEWIALIDAESLLPDRIAALELRINARDGGSGWQDLQIGFAAWARMLRGG